MRNRIGRAAPIIFILVALVMVKVASIIEDTTASGLLMLMGIGVAFLVMAK